MSTITKERIAQYANDPRMCNVNDEIRQMARIALASIEAEAVEWRVAFTLDGQSGSDFEKTFESQAKMNEVISLHERGGFSTSITPLYSAPPASVEEQRRAEEAKKRIAELQIVSDKCFLSGLKTGWQYGIADDTEGYNREIADAQAVIDRAATLQGDKQREISNEQ